VIVAMQESATDEQIHRVVERLVEHGYEVHRNSGVRQTVLGAVGHQVTVAPRDLEIFPGVQEVHRISAPYELAARGFRPEGTSIEFRNGLVIGGPGVVVMAGPCSVESDEQLWSAAEAVAKAGARVLRGGAFKPRSSPYSFQGLGADALKMLRQAGDQFGMLVISEVMEISQISLMLPYVDVFQVGTRNMQNFNLLKELGKVRKPVFLKRGIAATLDELLLSAEYILSGGNYNVILCERGIRTFDSHSRNTLDIGAVPTIKSLSHLPIFVDPSHSTGRRDRVTAMARAALAAGADGLLIEVHCNPDQALCDGAQSLYPNQFNTLMDEVRLVASAIGRHIS
jgi:3-deoxy-7-phosphoheptulonate synthase